MAAPPWYRIPGYSPGYALYRTGIQATWTYAGDFAASFGTDEATFVGQGFCYFLGPLVPLGEAAGFGTGVAGNARVILDAGLYSPTSPGGFIAGGITVSTGLDPLTYDPVNGYVLPAGRKASFVEPPFTFTQAWESLSGSYTYSIDLELIYKVSISGGGFPTFRDPSGNPFSFLDGPTTQAGLFYWTPRAGGTVSVSLSFGGLSASGSDPIPAGFEASPILLGAAVGFHQLACGATANPVATCTMTDDHGNSQVIEQPVTMGNLTLSGGPAGTAISNQNVFASLSMAPPRQSRLVADIRAMGGAYPGTVDAPTHYSANNGPYFPTSGAPTEPIDDVITTDAGGHIDQLCTQNIYSYLLTSIPTTAVWTVTPPASGLSDYWALSEGAASTVSGIVDEWQPAQWKLDYAWLESKGEFEKDVRCLIQAGHDRGFTLSHTSPRTLEPGDDAAKWTATNASVSIAGGLRAVVAGGVGSIVRNYTPGEMDVGTQFGKTWGKWWGSSRKLQFTAMSLLADNAPFRLTLVSDYNIGDPPGPLVDPYVVVVKTWNLHTGTAGSPVTITIDLCQPDEMILTNTLGTITTTVGDPVFAAWDTRYPMPTYDQRHWGVSWVSSLKLESLVDGETYTFGAFSAIRESFARLDALPSLMAFETYELQRSPSFGAKKPNRLLMVNVDGRMSIDVPYLYDNGEINFASWMCDETAICFPGFAVSNRATPDGSFYPDLSLQGAMLWGGGSYWNGSAWVDGIDQDVSTGLDIPIVGLLDTLDWPCWCGDPFSGTAPGAGVPIVVRSRKMLRGGAIGIAFGGGSTVQLYEGSTTTDAGSGSVNSPEGDFTTGAPYGRAYYTQYFGQYFASRPFDVLLDGEKVGTDPLYSRHRVRFTLSPPASSLGGLHNTTDKRGYYYEVTTANGDVLYWFSHHPTPAGFSGGWQIAGLGITTSGTASDPVIAVDDRNRIHVLYTDVSGVYHITSDDYGNSWSSAVVEFVGGKIPFVEMGHDGTLLIAAYLGTVTDGPYEIRTQGPGEPAMGAAQMMLDTSGTPLDWVNGKVSFTQLRDGFRRWVALGTIYGDTGPSRWVSKNLIHWERVI